jgi:hypothetical protein
MRQRRLNLAALAVNSSLGFALGTVLAMQAYQLGLVATGLFFDREPRWYPTRVEFGAVGPDIAWSGGTILVLLLGWALASIYRGGTRYDGTRLAVLWATLHFFREGLQQMLRVPFAGDSPVALTLAAWELPGSLSWVVGVLGATGLLAIGLLAAPALLRFARHADDLATKQGRVRFLGTIGILAWLVGALMTLPLVMADPASDSWSLLPWSGVFLVFTMLASPEPRTIDPIREPVRLAWGALVLLAVLVAAGRLFLVDGLAISL